MIRDVLLGEGRSCKECGMIEFLVLIVDVIAWGLCLWWVWDLIQSEDLRMLKLKAYFGLLDQKKFTARKKSLTICNKCSTLDFTQFKFKL